MCNFLYFLYSYGLLSRRHAFATTLYFPDSVSPDTFGAYLSHLYKLEYAWATIQQYTSQTKLYLESVGFQNPTLRPCGLPCPVYYAIWRSIKRKLHGDVRPRYPITAYHMHLLYLRCTTRKDKDDRPIAGLSKKLAANIWAAATLMWHALLRTSECNSKAIQLADKEATRASISFAPEGTPPTDDWVELDVQDCKTTPDPTRRGFKKRLWATGGNKCPVRAMRNLFKCEPSSSPHRPLFNYRKGGESGPPTGSRSRFSAWISKLLKASGIDDQFKLRKLTSHSFRAGACYTLAASGLPKHLLQLAGRWRSDAVEVYYKHVRESPKVLRDIGSRLAMAPMDQREVVGWQPP